MFGVKKAYAFTDTVSGQSVYRFTAPSGDSWMATSRFSAFRVRHDNTPAPTSTTTEDAFIVIGIFAIVVSAILAIPFLTA